MDIENAERIRLFVDDGEESLNAEAFLREQGVCFEKVPWPKTFPVYINIRGKGQIWTKKLGDHTILLPPIIEIDYSPGSHTILEGLTEICEEIGSRS